MEAFLSFLLVISVPPAIIFFILWQSERTKRYAIQRRLAETDYAARNALGARDQALWHSQQTGASTGQQLDMAWKKVEALTAEVTAARAYASARDTAIAAIATRYIDDTHKALVAKMTTSNLETSRSRFEKVVAFCAKHGHQITRAAAKEYDSDLLTAFKDAVRKDEAKQEQQRIKEQISDEQRAEAEARRQQEQNAREEAKVQEALAKALRQAKDEHSAEVAALQAQLLALQEKKRALSMAQLTRSGHIYVISNVGSFGDGVFKVGMTRRLEPQDRVDELGDASVPFPFDVHMMISCQDAPKLENMLHRELHLKRLNKVNLRKEFFRTTLDEIASIVRREHGHVDYQATPEAFEYHETRAIEERGTFGAFVEPAREEQLAEATSP